jgi:acyl dehydratase
MPVASAVRDPRLTERNFTITRDQISEYARTSGDHNPIHLDEDFARSVGLPGVIAHGMLQMGLLAVVAAEAAGGPSKLRSLSCRFAGMVEPGDTITIAAEKTADGRLVLRATNQRGEAVMTKATATYEP